MSLEHKSPLLSCDRFVLALCDDCVYRGGTRIIMLSALKRHVPHLMSHCAL